MARSEAERQYRGTARREFSRGRRYAAFDRAEQQAQRHKWLQPRPGDDGVYCAGNRVGAAAFTTGGGFHLPVSASLFGA